MGAQVLFWKLLGKIQDYEKFSQDQVNFISYAYKGVITLTVVKATSFQHWQAQKMQMSRYQWLLMDCSAQW